MGLRRKVMLFVIWTGLLFFMNTNCLAMELREDSVNSEEDNASSDLTQEYFDMYLKQETLSQVDDNLYDIQRQYHYGTLLSFEEIMKLLLEGKVDEAVLLVFQNLYESIFDEILLNKELMLRLILLVIIAAVFKNYSSMLKMSFIGEQGFYITYLLMAIILMQSFSVLYGIAEETVCYICDLMKCMLPALYLSLTLCGGFATSQMMNSMFLMILTFMETVLLKVVLPGTRVYFLIVVLNPINQEDRFSKLAGLVKQGLQFILKGIVTLTIGMNVVKGMLVPVYENTRYQVLQKGLSLLPGGAALTGLSSILLGAGVLIKNSVGITLVLVLLVFAGIPILKMFIIYTIYKFIAAMVQPISDKRILSGLQGICDSTGILLRAAYTSIVLSVLSVAIVILTTNIQ